MKHNYLVIDRVFNRVHGGYHTMGDAADWAFALNSKAKFKLYHQVVHKSDVWRYRPVENAVQ